MADNIQMAASVILGTTSLCEQGYFQQYFLGSCDFDADRAARHALPFYLLEDLCLRGGRRGGRRRLEKWLFRCYIDKTWGAWVNSRSNI